MRAVAVRTAAVPSGRVEARAEAVPAEWAEHGWSLGPATVASMVIAVLSASALFNWCFN